LSGDALKASSRIWPRAVLSAYSARIWTNAACDCAAYLPSARNGSINNKSPVLIA
jgi:hypothetical protein